MKLTLTTLALVSTGLALPTAEEGALSKRQYSSSTYNQLTDGTACRPISVRRILIVLWSNAYFS